MPRTTRRGFLGRIAGCGVAVAGLSIASPLPASAPAAASAPAMKFAICNETFANWPCERAFAFAAECGYTGIEIAPFTLAETVTAIPSSRRTEIRRLAERAKLEVLGLHWLLAKTKGFHVTHPDAAVRRKTVEYLGELARFCAELGGKLLVFGSPKQRNLAPGMNRADGMAYAAEVFTTLLPVLEKTGVVLAIEPLTSADTNFITTAADGVELVERIASPRCRLHLDCKAMSSEPTPIPELIRKYRTQFVHFHANDPNAQGPGFGRLDFVPIFRTLQEIGYRGWVSVEVFDARPGPERLARESINYMRKCLVQAISQRS